MNYNSETLYKLMILYMLKSAAEPLTLIQISTFFVEKEYTSFLNIQSHVKALEDQNFLAVFDRVLNRWSSSRYHDSINIEYVTTST